MFCGVVSVANQRVSVGGLADCHFIADIFKQEKGYIYRYVHMCPCIPAATGTTPAIPPRTPRNTFVCDAHTHASLAFLAKTYQVQNKIRMYPPRTPRNVRASWRAGDQVFCRQDRQEKKFRLRKEKCCNLFCPPLIMGHQNRKGQSNALNPRSLHPRQVCLPHRSPHHAQGYAPALDTGCMGGVTAAPSWRA